MLTEQQILAVKIQRECGLDEHEIVDSFDTEGVSVFLGEINLILAEKRYETRN